MEIERESSLGRDFARGSKGGERKNREYLLYRFTGKERRKRALVYPKKLVPTSLTFSPLRFLSFLSLSSFALNPFPLFFTVRHAIEVTRVSSLGKKLTVAPFTQNCRHSNGEAIHRCAGGRCFPSYDSTRYQPLYSNTYIYIYVIYTHTRTNIHSYSTCIYHLVDNPSSRAEVAANWSKTGLPRVRISSSPTEFSRLLIPLHLSSSASSHTLSHMFTSYMFSFLSFPADTETTVCDPLVICATSGSYFDVGARGFADARP